MEHNQQIGPVSFPGRGRINFVKYERRIRAGKSSGRTRFLRTINFRPMKTNINRGLLFKQMTHYAKSGTLRRIGGVNI